MRVALALLPLALVACRSTSATPPADEAGAHRAHEAYVAAINSNDVGRMLDMFTDDVVLMAPGTPVFVGKDAIRPWLEGYVAWAHTHWDKPVRELVVNGDWAFERYDWASTDTPHDGSGVVTDTGWGFLIYRREADGVWRVARDAWGTDHPAP